jgi:GntR family transcriptional regulator/MocR family aminotransferase
LQRTAAYFLALGHYDAVIHRMRIEYHKRHIVMIDALEREGLKIAGKSGFGGTAFWIEGPEGMDADKLARDLREDGVLIESGAPFFWSDDRPCRYFRIAYSSIPINRIADGIKLLASRMRQNS